MTSQAYRDNYRAIRWSPIRSTQPAAREGNKAPHVILDTMSETWHPATGKIVTSKSEFRRMTRAAGCEEVGNSAFPARERPSKGEIGRDVKMALEQLRSRR